MGGDKIVLLDGAGANGGGAATNGLLSMIPGMFANLNIKMLKIGSNLYPRSEPIFPNTRPDAILTYRVFILIHIVLF